MTKLSTIGQIPMVVKDVPRAVTFYRDTLGMRFFVSGASRVGILRLRRHSSDADRAGGEGVRPSGIADLL
jgi:catechol 2,3-dioxygenase-like lactoylglutathione lyase family enzyme